ncbi:MAG: TIR domain-containing protein [Symploca sp. SIO3E6]|nr:TIR domain-containing protein [Caldora sp. SIO3E6]
MPCAVILTALPVEYQSVCNHLKELQDEIHPQGTIYERGKFLVNGQKWEVGIAEVGAGNAQAAVEAERAIAYFQPNILLFVGIAGGIKDVAIGDVVVATDVYGYESGKVGEQFFPRPKVGKSAYALVQRAKLEARKKEWLQRLSSNRVSQPRVFLAPIAAGDKVVASRKSDIFQFLRASYNDAIALEMEGFGFLNAAFAYPNMQAVVIRGISDLIEGKNDDSVEPEAIRQEKAAQHASAFAFEMLSKLLVHHNKLDESARNGDAERQRKRPSRIFISYTRDTELDELVAGDIFEALNREHQVFIDRAMVAGTPWAEQVEREIRQSDFFIVLLSEFSVHSEMVEQQIRLAYHLAREQAGNPAILPIRINYRGPFRYPLSEYLNSINWAFWQGKEDTSRLIAELSQAILGGELPISSIEAKQALLLANPPEEIPQPHYAAQPLPLEMPEGTMDTESRFYVERSSDVLALSTIQQQGVTITIKGPRQMGKSSLLMRLMNKALAAGKRIVFLDFQMFDKTTLTNADQFFHEFCTWLSGELEVENRVNEYWSQVQSNNLRCTRYLQRYLLKQLDSPLVLAMDEVECIFDATFRSDFFSMLRSWHNNRAIPSTPIWKQLDLALVTSTEPYQFIENLSQSPFNVGQVIELADFTPQQITDLNQRHGLPLNRAQESQLMSLVDGHPYLVRRALYLVASQQITVADLFAKAAGERGPFGEHLRYHLFRMHDKKNLVQGFLQVLRHHTCQDERVFFREGTRNRSIRFSVILS